MNFYLQINTYKKQNGTQSIRLRIFTNSRDIQYIDTKISVLKNQWDIKKQMVKKHPLEENYNSRLSEIVSEVKKLHYKNQGISARRLLQIYKNVKKHDTHSLTDYYQSVIDDKISREEFRTAKTFQHYLDKLKKFSKNVTFNDLSKSWGKEYELFLRNKGNKENTIASNFKALHSVINNAVKMGLIENNKLKGFTVQSVNVEKETLTLQEIECIINLEIPLRNKGMIKARDMLLFAFYTAGMRFTDMCNLKWSNIVDDSVVYTMNKSKTRSGSRRSIPLNPKSIEILDKYKGKDVVYVFPVLYGYDKKSKQEQENRIYIQNNNLNRALKIIARDCEIDKPISMHMAKHSFANHLVNNEVDLLMISKLLGHTKLSTTQHYLKDFYQKEESDIMKKVFG